MYVIIFASDVFSKSSGRLLQLKYFRWLSLNDGWSGSSGTHLNRDGTLSHLDVTIVSKTKCIWNTMNDWIEIAFNELPLFEQAHMVKFKIKKADWETFKMVCKENINSGLINSFIEITNKNIMNQSWRLQKHAFQRKKQEQNKMVPYWNDEFWKVEVPPCNTEPISFISPNWEKQDTEALSSVAILSNSPLFTFATRQG